MPFETHLREEVSEAARNLGVCTEQESYLIVHVCSRVVAMHMFCQAGSNMPPSECRRWSLIWVCLIVLFVVRKGCLRVSFVVWGTKNVATLCLLYNIYHRVEHPMIEYLKNFVAVRNTRACPLYVS